MTKEELDKLRDANQIDITPEYENDKYGTYSTGVFKYKGTYILVTKDDGKWHLSISAQYPLGYYQIKEVRYKFLPNAMEVVQIFPPREQFVNIHSNSYHLFEL